MYKNIKNKISSLWKGKNIFYNKKISHSFPQSLFRIRATCISCVGLRANYNNNNNTYFKEKIK